MATLDAVPVSQPAAPPPDSPLAAPMTVLVLERVADLEAHVAAWTDLAGCAIEPNPFQEPWMLLPALRAFARDCAVIFVLVYVCDPARPNGPPVLGGLFPMQRKRRYKALPITTLTLWRHLHCTLATPLIRRDCGMECLAALFDWLKSDRRGAAVLEFAFIAADGPFYQLLVNFLNERGRLTFVEETTTRALLTHRGESEAYLQAAMSSGNRKELRRQRRRLGELGHLEVRHLGAQSSDDVEAWIDYFLHLESSGWKGQHGTALTVHANDRAFFREIANAAFQRERLMMLGLFFDDKPVALKCNFLASDGVGSIAFKIAYDEAFARFSPGVQLELENILEVHRRPALKWMDSCAISQHFMINRLWRDRRVMQSLLIATGRRGGDLAVSVLPLLRWLRRLVRRKK